MWLSKIKSELVNIDFELQPIPKKISIFFYCFAKPCKVSGTNQPITMGFPAKCGARNV